jgi:hypothetical protein
MKRLPERILLAMSLWCGTTCYATGQPATTPAVTTPATAQTDTPDAVEMIPPASHWPGVVVGAAGGLFALAAVIGPLVLTQSRRKAAYSLPAEKPPQGSGRGRHDI